MSYTQYRDENVITMNVKTELDKLLNDLLMRVKMAREFARKDLEGNKSLENLKASIHNLNAIVSILEDQVIIG